MRSKILLATAGGLVGLIVGIGLSWWLLRPAPAPTGSADKRMSTDEVETQEQEKQRMRLAQAVEELAQQQQQLQQTLDQQTQEIGDIQTRLNDQPAQMQSAVRAELAAANKARFAKLVSAGFRHQQAGDYAAAVEVFNQALALDPDGFPAYVNRGMCQMNLRNWEAALRDFEQARQVDPDNFMPWNNIAWIRATCPDAKFRNGEIAKAAAEKAVDLTDGRNFTVLETLAAAHAELGEFDEAIAVQNQAAELAPAEARQTIRATLALYERETPFREAAAPQSGNSTEEIP